MSDAPTPDRHEADEHEHPHPAPDPGTTAPGVHPDDGSHTPPHGDELLPHEHRDG
ncbi:MAG TPA: hypothetical protein VD931_23200 [Baekduia sp.]|nr:hypothetical protein [Baekduia sp.]